MDLLISDEVKKAFRVSYDFLNNHASAINTPAEYKSLAEDLCNAFAENMNNPLACRLLSGVWDFICAESKRLTK